MARNYMKDFMQGYDWVDQNKRQDKVQAQRDEDRMRRLSREEKADTRMDELYQRQIQALDDAEEQKGLLADSYKVDTILDGLRRGDETAIIQAQELAANDPRIMKYMMKLQTPEGLQQAEEDVNIIEGAFKGEKVGKQKALDAANRVMEPWINSGEGGENKRLIDLYPAPSGNGFVAELEFERDGKTHREPLTSNRGSGKDETVKEIPADKLLLALNMLKQDINQRRVQLGDTGPIQARAAGQKRALDREEKYNELDYRQQHKIELENLKQRNKAALEGLKNEATGSGVDGKEFRQHLSDLESLYGRKASIQRGYDPLTGEVIPQENIDQALATVQTAINDRERYVQSIAPQLWEKYRPAMQDTVPQPQQGDGRPPIQAIFGGGQAQGGQPQQQAQGRPGDMIRTQGMPQEVPPPTQQVRNLTRENMQRASLQNVQRQVNQNFNRDNPISKTGDAIERFFANGAAQVNQALNNVARVLVIDPARAAASGIVEPFKRFQAWARSRYSNPDEALSAEALEMYAQESPQDVEMIASALTE